MSNDFDEIWKEYHKSRDPGLKEQIILKYAYLVKYVAGRLSMHVGQYVDFEDLVSYGIFGLIDAIDKFNFARGVKFETYASLRIRGEIIDSIRKLDWVPRSLRQKSKQLEQAYTSMESELGRAPTESELAEKLNISISEIQDLIKKSSLNMVVSLDDFLDQDNEMPMINVVNSNSETPELLYEKQELKTILIDAINELNEKQRKVVSLYYFEELTLKEISLIMGVSESRVSQIHKISMEKLKAKLGKYKSILFLN